MNLDLSHLLDVFLAEAAEHLETLDHAIILLERGWRDDTLDRTALDELFRAAHSLKGMCGMMGYSSMSALTHAMEESLVGVRSGAETLDQKRIDTLLECVDALEEALNDISESRGEPATMQSLAMRVGAAPTPGDSRPKEQPPEEQTERATLPDDAIAVHVTLAADTDIPAARALIILQTLERFATILATTPERAATLTGRHFDLLVRGTDADALVRALSDMPEVERVECHAADAEPAQPANRPEAAPRQSAGRTGLEPTIRVSSGRLDSLMFQVQEVLIAAERVRAAIPPDADAQLRGALAELGTQTHRLQAEVMQVRMTPLEVAFARVPRLVRDLAARLGRQVELQLEDSHVEVDRSTVDALADPLVHLIRNALDHGIETPEERTAAGKSDSATLRITPRHHGDSVTITVSDDGRGIDIEAIATRAIERGTLDARAVEHARERGTMLDLLFLPGVSGAAAETDISGRGVGLDVVRSTVRDLGGDLSLESALGRGTQVTLRLPLTLAILPTLIVRSASREVAIPLDRVLRIIELDGATTPTTDGHELLAADRTSHRLVHLAHALGADADDALRGDFAVLVGTRRGRMALAVDGVEGTCDVATRALPPALATESLPLLAVGLMPDGSLTTIVDCDRLTPSGSAA